MTRADQGAERGEDPYGVYREPPHSGAAEQTVVGAILISNDAYDKISWLQPEAFYFENNRVAWTAIRTLIEGGKQADVVTVFDECERVGHGERCGGPSYLGAMAQNCVGPANIEAHASIIRDRAICRKLAQYGSEACGEALAPAAPPMEIAEKYEALFLSILDSKADRGEPVHIGKALAEHFEWTEAHPHGIATGIQDLDSLTGGLHGGNLVVIAGRPHMGKTGLGLQIAETICAGEPGLMFTLEAPRREIANRLLAWNKFKMGKDAAADRIYAMNLMISDAVPLTPGLIRGKVRRIKRLHGCKALLVDYLQLVSGKGDNREQEVAFVSRQLKLIAMENEIPVLVMAQIGRKVEERVNKRPTMADLRESGAIEADADLIYLVYRDDYYQPDFVGRFGEAEIIVPKNRNNGRTGTVKLLFDRETSRFVDRVRTENVELRRRGMNS